MHEDVDECVRGLDRPGGRRTAGLRCQHAERNRRVEMGARDISRREDENLSSPTKQAISIEALHVVLGFFRLFW